VEHGVLVHSLRLLFAAVKVVVEADVPDVLALDGEDVGGEVVDPGGLARLLAQVERHGHDLNLLKYLFVLLDDVLDDLAGVGLGEALGPVLVLRLVDVHVFGEVRLCFGGGDLGEGLAAGAEVDETDLLVRVVGEAEEPGFDKYLSCFKCFCSKPFLAGLKSTKAPR